MQILKKPLGFNKAGRDRRRERDRLCIDLLKELFSFGVGWHTVGDTQARTQARTHASARKHTHTQLSI